MVQATSAQMIENGKKWVKKLEDKVNLEWLDIQRSRCVRVWVCLCLCLLCTETPAASRWNSA